MSKNYRCYINITDTLAHLFFSSAFRAGFGADFRANNIPLIIATTVQGLLHEQPHLRGLRRARGAPPRAARNRVQGGHDHARLGAHRHRGAGHGHRAERLRHGRRVLHQAAVVRGAHRQAAGEQSKKNKVPLAPTRLFQKNLPFWKTSSFPEGRFTFFWSCI